MTIVDKEKNIKRLFSPTTIIIAVLLIVIVANIVAWKTSFAKNEEIDNLTGEINRINQEIQKAPLPAADLEVKLEQAQAGLAAAQTAFPTEFNRNDIIDYIIGLARECQVEVLPISSQGWLAEKSGSVLKLNSTITGTFTRASEFIYKLQHGKYETLVIPEMSFTRQSTTVGTGFFSGDNTPVTVRLSISIYARPAAMVKGNN